jgi:hypothetical protein
LNQKKTKKKKKKEEEEDLGIDVLVENGDELHSESIEDGLSGVELMRFGAAHDASTKHSKI